MNHLPQFFALNSLDQKLEKYVPFEKGTFFEAGANDGYKQSNSLYFERYRGWRGILVEPSPVLFKRCKNLRDGLSQCFNAALVPPEWMSTDVELTYCDLMSVTNSEMTKVSQENHVETGKQYLSKGDSTYAFKAPARTISSIIEESGIRRINLMTLDIEGFEGPALRGLDVERHTIDFICVECWDRNAITEILERNFDLVDQLSHHDYLFKNKRLA